MKKTVFYVAIATLVLVFASCKKNKNEWEKYYGYTSNDICGNYSFSNASDAFESLTAGEFCKLCSDAVISIASSGENRVGFGMVSDEFDYNKSYMGKAPASSHDFMIDIKGSTQSLSHTSFIGTFLNSTVYKNAEGKIRLKGNSAHNRYNIKFHIIYDDHHNPVDTIPDTTLYSSTRYYFDVIKN